jgi:DNA topoisomerase-1
VVSREGLSEGELATAVAAGVAETDPDVDKSALVAAEAAAAGLSYVHDTDPGIRRRRAGKGWSFIGPDGKAIRDKEAIARIRSLAIPPAYKDVWICPDPRGHIQATGRDEKGAQAVPLPRRLGDLARGAQVRAHGRVRRRPS